MKFEGILGDFRLPGLQPFEQLAEAGVSLHWMAPEVLTTQGKEASPKSDLWSMAATICEMMTRNPPHSELTRSQLTEEYSNKVRQKLLHWGWLNWDKSNWDKSNWDKILLIDAPLDI